MHYSHLTDILAQAVRAHDFIITRYITRNQSISLDPANNEYVEFKEHLNIFCERLRAQMKGKSILAFSKSIDIPERTINGWMRGAATPSMEYIIHLAKKLNCTSDYLLGLEDY